MLWPSIFCNAVGSSSSTFANPGAKVRPKFRYWVPDASVDPAVVASDVKAAGDAGLGGFELLGFYLYGGPTDGTPVPVNWATYGFGTPAWRTSKFRYYSVSKTNIL
jgi:hypothetical protein